jgi:hypothetical protein
MIISVAGVLPGYHPSIVLIDYRGSQIIGFVMLTILLATLGLWTIYICFRINPTEPGFEHKVSRIMNSTAGKRSASCTASPTSFWNFGPNVTTFPSYLAEVFLTHTVTGSTCSWYLGYQRAKVGAIIS